VWPRAAGSVDLWRGSRTIVNHIRIRRGGRHLGHASRSHLLDRRPSQMLGRVRPGHRLGSGIRPRHLWP
jgi:hypothetical protein